MRYEVICETEYMDTDTYEQFPLSKEQIGDSLKFLKEQITVDLVLFREKPVTIEMPLNVDLEVTETVPGFKGDTAQGGTKPARLETGHTLNVPLFVNLGDTVKVDTRSGDYLSRV